MALLHGKEALLAIDTIIQKHYTKSVPSGKTYWMGFEEAIISWSIPANRHISSFLVGEPNSTWELTRLWAPDGHPRNLLSRAIKHSLREFRNLEPATLAVISYADPNAGHSGGVYKAASWIFCGQSEEGRYYTSPTGETVSRRKFHCGKRSLRKAEILALGYTETKKTRET